MMVKQIVLDGDILGIKPDDVYSTVLKKIVVSCKNKIKILHLLRYTHKATIMIGNKEYILKCRKTGACDFKWE